MQGENIPLVYSFLPWNTACVNYTSAMEVKNQSDICLVLNCLQTGAI